ncbi:hypothetical protein [Actinopolymorpha pittospori]|uniref:Ferric iron reductase protein FhuF n=1 Tax=Actinopolymorpha pittospori TaxID=648752 RepID=A0A927N2E4_9ACTN|nr:hypothetical protein [Actinopolymorpha pittospori]MBE1609043.1 ferric iron reductase protein FhuF [Actinopolymorpha pittospori]
MDEHVPERVRAALARLQSPPTSAPLRLLHEPPPREVSDDESGVLAGWWPVPRLTEAPFWERLAAAYSAGLETPHLPVGGACGLQHYAGRLVLAVLGQHYAGRLVLAVLGAWVQTGHLPPLAHERWWMRLDENGHTLDVGLLAPVEVWTSTAPGEPMDVEGSANALLTGHFGPIVEAARSATRITARLAYGCVAASRAGAFASLHRRAVPEDRVRVRDVAERFLRAGAWPDPDRTVTFTEIGLPQTSALVHERRTCCLIRLGTGHAACSSCPDIPREERWPRLVAAAASRDQASDLRVVVGRG